MRTFLLILLCLGVGFGLANYQHTLRHAGEAHVMGSADFQVSQASDKSALQDVIDSASVKKVGKIEVVNGTELDFGLMMAGTKRSHKFIFKNVGQADAKIWFLKSTCKCTIGKFENAVLKPGEETEVELEWKAESQFDEFAQSATIGTDCPNQEEIKLMIQGRLGQAFVFDPPAHSIGDIYSNTETVVPVSIYSFQESPLDISAAQVQDGILSKKIKVELAEERHLKPGELPEKADARHVVDAKIRLSPGLPAGPLNLIIKFARKSSGREQEVEFLEYNVRARCITPVRIIAGDDYSENRNIYNLGVAKSSEGLKKRFMIAVRREDSDADPNVRIAKSTPSQLKATLGEPSVTAAQRIYPITLEVPPGSDPVELDGTFSKDFGKIVIETDMESSPQIPIYVKFRITE
ncbi:MAG: DUF1573 domain-containing protein [Planctomycetota bacterium]|jgi:hypothetical protein